MGWYDEWFDEEYVRVYGHRDLAEARRDVAFAEKVLELRRSELILDLCCGNGRHLLALCEKGYKRLVGVDLSLPLLRLARDSITRRACLTQVLLADMRRLPCRERFDAVLNLFTSFGYFDTDEENRQVLRSMAAALRPGGRFVLDYLNAHRVVQTLQGRSERMVEGRRVIETRAVDPERRRVNKQIAIHTPQGVKHYEESVRLYKQEEMSNLFRDSGLEVTVTYGDFDGRLFNPDAPRMIFVGRKRR